MKNGLKNHQAGQSLMETIIAIGLVMSVVISSIGLGIYTTRLGRGSQNRLVAINLAREGIEAVRNMRDSNWLALRAWDAGIRGTCDANGWCLAYPSFSSGIYQGWVLANYSTSPVCVKDVPSNTCRLNLESHNMYTHEAGTATNFYRGINITGGNLQPLKIVSKVIWWENNMQKTIILEEDLTNWRYE